MSVSFCTHAHKNVTLCIIASNLLASSGIMQGAQEVVEGVFMGGFEEARFGIRRGFKQAEQFRSSSHIATVIIALCITIYLTLFDTEFA